MSYDSNENSDLELSFKCTPSEWVLLKCQSTFDVFINPDLLSDIRSSSKNLKIHCNAGITSVTMLGEISGYGTIWFHPDGIAKIVTLSRLKSKFLLTYDSRGRNQFDV